LSTLPLYLLICFSSTLAFAAEPDMSAAALKIKYTELNKQLLNNQFQRPLYLNSAESSHDLKGDIYAVVDYSFPAVSSALNNPEHWCDLLILHVNIKYCRATNTKTGPVLTVNLGQKYDQPLADTYVGLFNYRGVTATSDYFAIELSADSGPLGTHDYKMWIEATPLKDKRTFIHFSYAYSFGLAGRLTMQSYLATLGRGKVGFTVIGQLANGQPSYIQGVRGVVERNTMRYYLAIDAYLAALTLPPEEQLEKRLQRWYNGTDQYALQLHEVEWTDYLEMKHKEYDRQQPVQ
jgi:hypothetical protein